jgi:hypothetical protein
VSIKATHVPRSNARSGGGIPATVRYGTENMWPGIFTGFNALCTCTWAPYQGKYQVKRRDGACLVREHHQAGTPNGRGAQ